MKPRVHIFIATSLDGFIARSDGSVDWLDLASAALPEGEDCGYGAFISDIDEMALGRNTFEKVMSLGEWPYGAIPVTVFSRRLSALPVGTPATVSLTRQSPRAYLAERSRNDVRNVYVDGGLIIQSFLAEGLVYELTVTTIPILIGEGKRLFGALPGDLHWRLLSSRSYPSGFVQSRYRVFS